MPDFISEYWVINKVNKVYISLSNIIQRYVIFYVNLKKDVFFVRIMTKSLNFQLFFLTIFMNKIKHSKYEESHFFGRGAFMLKKLYLILWRLAPSPHPVSKTVSYVTNSAPIPICSFSTLHHVSLVTPPDQYIKVTKAHQSAPLCVARYCVHLL